MSKFETKAPRGEKSKHNVARRMGLSSDKSNTFACSMISMETASSLFNVKTISIRYYKTALASRPDTSFYNSEFKRITSHPTAIIITCICEAGQNLVLIGIYSFAPAEFEAPISIYFCLKIEKIRIVAAVIRLNAFPRKYRGGFTTQKVNHTLECLRRAIVYQKHTRSDCLITISSVITVAKINATKFVYLHMIKVHTATPSEIELQIETRANCSIQSQPDRGD
mmetsp:Transcript_17700/g.26854  ORF Transcript_17700/g.26854 Transcript_17700/m.26854 type:complete len:224 (-) Transcript_17700:3694-4365(-)